MKITEAIITDFIHNSDDLHTEPTEIAKVDLQSYVSHVRNH